MRDAARLAALARMLKEPVAQPRAFVGLDGFIDEVVHAVDIRQGPDMYTRIPTLAAYGERVGRAAGLSTNIELVTVHEKMGGSGPNFACALVALGVAACSVGSLGVPAPHAVFAPLDGEGCEVIGIAPPGHTDAIEFLDGKLICSKVQPLAQVTWEALLAALTPEGLIRRLREASLISLNNWSMVHGMDAIWRGLQTEILPQVSPAGKVLFFDLVDPQGRGPDALREALRTMSAFSDMGFCTILGLNLKEARQVAHALGCLQAETLPLQPLTAWLHAAMGIAAVVIHPLREAACVWDGAYACVDGPYCAEPKLTTGAGDHFNAGFIYGVLRGLDVMDCLRLGVALSGSYVRNAQSPTRAQLASFLEAWAADQV